MDINPFKIRSSSHPALSPSTRITARARVLVLLNDMEAFISKEFSPPGLFRRVNVEYGRTSDLSARRVTGNVGVLVSPDLLLSTLSIYHTIPYRVFRIHRVESK